MLNMSFGCRLQDFREACEYYFSFRSFFVVVEHFNIQSTIQISHKFVRILWCSPTTPAPMSGRIYEIALQL